MNQLQIEEVVPDPVPARLVTHPVPSVLPQTVFRIDWIAVGMFGLMVAGMFLMVFVGLRRSDPMGPIDYPAAWVAAWFFMSAGFIGWVFRLGRRWTK